MSLLFGFNDFSFLGVEFVFSHVFCCVFHIFMRGTAESIFGCFGGAYFFVHFKCAFIEILLARPVLATLVSFGVNFGCHFGSASAPLFGCRILTFFGGSFFLSILLKRLY